MIRRQKIRIHQFHSGSSVADAVTNCMFFVQAILQSFGFASEIFVEHVDPALSGQLRPLADLQLAETDFLLIHHSMGHDALSRIADLHCRKFLVYHNITPPEFFSERDPTRSYVLKGYSQLSLLRDIVESAIAVSPSNARQLSQRGFADVSVIPLLKDFTAIRYLPHSKTPYYDAAAVFRLLFVGRIAPHKCQHELIDFVDRVRSIGHVPLELVLVGHFADADDYKSHLDQLVDGAGLGRHVKITGRVTDRELFGWYRAASAFVSLSEHEGFGVPLVEAMAFDLPVVAYRSSGVADTLGGAGIAISDKAPAGIIEPLVWLRQDPRFRAETIRSQRARLLRFGRPRIEAELRGWLARAGAYGDEATAPAGRDAGNDDGSRAAPRTHYVIEGPFETSYSLAIVNRNIALALDEGAARASCIEPADGVESYSVDPIAAGKLPSKVVNLVRPAPVSADRIVTIRNTYPPRPNGLLGDVRLLHLAWEESSIPDTLAELINLHLDGVLVPSEYCRRVIRDSGVRLPIGVIGHGIDHSGRLPQMIGDRIKRGPATPALPFTFVHISSGLARKGIEELITAYCLAFSRADPVLLVIKTFDNPTNTIDSWIDRLTGKSDHAPAIQVIADGLDERQLEFLYHIADAIVLPTRGEGFNLPAAEGMARGLPVITTRHGGHLDFCNDDNAFLVDCACEISTSHLKVANSYWARPSIEHLVEAMKTVHRAGRSPHTMAACRAARGQFDASRLRWRDVAERVDHFVEHLDSRPVMTRKLRLGWISTYNARCGIATHSEHLLEFFDKQAFEITIIADDQETIAPDSDNVKRLWSKGGGLARVTDYLIENKFDAAFFQHNFSFFDFDDFADALIVLAEAGINTYVTFHRTEGLEDASRTASHQAMAKALQSCTRLFVHGIDDVNRLRRYGATDNVVLLAHGVIDRAPLNADAVRSLVGLAEFGPIIGTFGFLLPGKGLTELIYSLALILRAHPGAYLLMLNADYPTAESAEERRRCRELARLLDLEGRMRLVNEFLDIEETLFLLSACDVIVFPYQHSQESASGAVRLGLAAGRPVLTTPLPIFADLSEIVHQLPGTDGRQIAEGIISFLAEEGRKTEILQRQRDWVRANSWAAQAARLSNIIAGCFAETRGVELRTPSGAGSGLTPDAEIPLRGTSSVRREPDLLAAQSLLGRRAANWELNGPAAAYPVAPPASETADASRAPAMPAAGPPQPPRQGPGFLHKFASRPPLFEPKPAENGLIARADRARDARDWATAARYYQSALERKRDNPAIWVQYGHALKESGKVEEAENAYRASLEFDRGIADTHLQLGHALKIQGRRVEAGAAYLRALVLDPALVHASFELKALGWTTGRIELALRRERSGVS